MNKKLKITLALGVATLLFTGCGGGSSGTDIQETTSVEVERGKVYDSNVTDASGKVATKTAGSNIYVFSGTPTYPITANGGWIDLDGDGDMTTADIALDVNLTSYSTVVTPITTYLADVNSTKREQKLQELALSLGTTAENLLKVPSKGTKDTIIAANAIFKEMKIAPNTPPTTLSLTDINTTLSTLKTTYNQSFTGEADIATLAKTFEQAVVNGNSSLFTKLTDEKILALGGTVFPTYSAGFNSNWLEGKTLYDVYQNKLGENSWGNTEATTMKFENGKLHIAAGISTDFILHYDYNVTSNGLIAYYDNVNYFNDTNFVATNRYIHFNSFNNNFIEVCYGSHLDSVSSCEEDRQNHEVFFLDIVKAREALNNSDFFSYIGQN